MERVGSVKQQLQRLFGEAFRDKFPDELDIVPIITPCKDLRHGDYQWYAKASHIHKWCIRLSMDAN